MNKRQIFAMIMLLVIVAWCFGAAKTNSPYTGAGWATDAPNDEAIGGNSYLELQDLRKGVEMRANRGHLTYASSSVGGWHLNGSAVCYEGTTEEPNLPDDSAALSDIARDRGRLWVNDNFNPPVLERWDGSAFEVVGTIAAGSAPIAYLTSDANENTDGGRESKIIYKGVKTDGTLHELIMVQGSHDTTGDDYKADIIFFVNDGDDANGSLTEVFRIDSAKLATFTGAATITGNVIVGANKLTVAAASGNTVIAGTCDVTGVATLGDGSLLKTSAAPSTDAMIANKKYVDDNTDANLPLVTDSESNTMLKAHAYLAQTTGFVNARATGTNEDIKGYVGSDNDPCGTGALISIDKVASGERAEICFLVPSGAYFEILRPTDTPTIYWTSLVEGGGQPIDQD